MDKSLVQLYKGFEFVRRKFKGDVSTAQLAIFLTVITKEGIGMGDLEDLLKMEQYNVSKNVSKLEKGQALIVKQPDPQDARRTVLYLTMKGKKLRLDLLDYINNLYS